MDIELTKEEENAINTLKRLGKRWPSSLWIFAGGGGTLSIMRFGKDGYPVLTEDGGMDPEYCVADISIVNDGGNW